MKISSKSLILLLVVSLLAISPALWAGGQKEPVKAGAAAPAATVETVKIQIMTRDGSAPARVNNFNDAAKALNAELEKEKAPQRVEVDAFVKQMTDPEFDKYFIFAAQSNNSCDIYATNYSKIGWMANGNYLQPLDGIEKAPVLKNLMPGLWNAVTWQGHIYGVIQDMEARPIFVFKPALKKLGWTDAQIAALPGRVESGDFLLRDFIALAKESVAKGATKYGLLHPTGGSDLAVLFISNGTWFYDEGSQKFVLDKAKFLETFQWLEQMGKDQLIPKQFIGVDKNELLKAFVNGQTLFLLAGVWDEAKWRTSGFHSELGNVSSDWIEQNIGVMFMPASDKSVKPSTISNPWVYVVPKSTKNPQLIQRLLQAVSVPELQAKHGTESSHIPFTAEGMTAVKDNAWLTKVGFLLKSTKFMPLHPDKPKFEKILSESTSNVVTGKMTSAQAVEWMEKQMKLDMGDIIVK